MHRLIIAFFGFAASLGVVSAQPLVIAHRGASGYLPEHTLAAAAYAHALGADYIEQDLVMSRDNVLVVLHDIHLDTTTDVAARFPGRHREDGRYYAVDFDWAELAQLTVHERFDAATGKPVFPSRYPATTGPLRLCRMEDQLQLIHGLNRSTGREVGLYPEIKAPAWHRREGKDPGLALIALLDHHGYRDAHARVFVQCFDPAELKRLRQETGTTLPFVQLIGDNAWNEADTDYEALLTPAGLGAIATYAEGIGPHLSQVLHPDGSPRPLVAAAQDLGFVVHPYTVRTDALPPGVPDVRVLLDLLFRAARVDGVFIDQPDVAVAFLKP